MKFFKKLIKDNDPDEYYLEINNGKGKGKTYAYPSENGCKDVHKLMIHLTKSFNSGENLYVENEDAPEDSRIVKEDFLKRIKIKKRK